MGKYSKLLKEVLEEKCNNQFSLFYKMFFADSLDRSNTSLNLCEQDEDYIIDLAYERWMNGGDEYSIDNAIDDLLAEFAELEDDSNWIEQYKERQKQINGQIERMLSLKERGEK